MRILIANEKEVSILKLKLVQDGEKIVVKTLDPNGDEDWELLTFSVQDGNLVFYRNEGVNDDRISTDSDGNIEEVDE